MDVRDGDAPPAASEEERALWSSLGAAVFIGAVAMAAFGLSGSDAILLDGVFNLAFAATAYAAIRVAAASHKPSSDAWPFGQAWLVSLVTLLKGALMLALCAFAFVGAVNTVAMGGMDEPPDAAVGMAYACVAVAASFATWWHLSRSLAHPGPLIEADATSWGLNVVFSSAILISFAVQTALSQMDIGRGVLRYIDPCVVLAMVALSVSYPVAISHRALLELVNAGGAPEVAGLAREAAKEALSSAGLAFQEVQARAIQPGDICFVSLTVLLAEEDCGIRRQDGVRAAVRDALEATFPRGRRLVVDCKDTHRREMLHLFD